MGTDRQARGPASYGAGCSIWALGVTAPTGTRLTQHARNLTANVDEHHNAAPTTRFDGLIPQYPQVA